MTPEADETNGHRRRRKLTLLVTVWAVLAAAMILLARQNLSVPGLYYDEAVFAGMAKDFITGNVHGEHMPDHQVVRLAGRPFPLFIQTYLGTLKSWMLIPAFRIFGPTVAVLRATTLFWSLIALLLLMLGIWRWLGLATALIAGALLAFDPTYFFLSVLDWGVVVPSLVCRCACLYFAVRWNQQSKLRDAFFVGLFAGLGFFNKADFAVILIAVGVAALFCSWRSIVASIGSYSVALSLAGLGFVIGSGPMLLLKIPRILMLTAFAPPPGELVVKLHALGSMYDGSYFYRLMNVGGLFERMHETPTSARDGLGLALIIAVVVFVVIKIRSRQDEHTEGAMAFLVLATALVTLGVMVLPYAARIHHMVLVFPLPQLLIGTVSAALWQIKEMGQSSRRPIRTPVFIGLLILLASQLRMIQKTEQLIQQTGGRGRWSESLDAFCRENRSRSDLTIVSLDWGFNEQLMFLTDEPQLAERFWGFDQRLPVMPTGPHYLYLVHPPKYSEFRYDQAYLNAAQKSGQKVQIEPHFDRENEIAFYVIRFPPQ